MKWHVFMDSPRRFIDTVLAEIDHGRAAKIVVYIHTHTHEHSTYYFRGSPSTYSTDPRLQEVYTLLVTCRIHPRICWRHCTTIFV